MFTVCISGNRKILCKRSFHYSVKHPNTIKGFLEQLQSQLRKTESIKEDGSLVDQGGRKE